MVKRDGKVGKVTIQGRQLTCPVCGCEEFWWRDTMLNTSTLTLFKLDWADKNAKNYVCDTCGYMFWFHPQP